MDSRNRSESAAEVASSAKKTSAAPWLLGTRLSCAVVQGCGPWVIVPHLPMRSRESPVRLLLNLLCGRRKYSRKIFARNFGADPKRVFISTRWERFASWGTSRLVLNWQFRSCGTSPCAFPDCSHGCYGEEYTFRNCQGLERKIRVLVDWTIELFFPRDIVQTIDLQ